MRSEVKHVAPRLPLPLQAAQGAELAPTLVEGRRRNMTRKLVTTRRARRSALDLEIELS